MAVTKLAINLDRHREARADDERIRCASTLRKSLEEFLVEHRQPGSERRRQAAQTQVTKVLEAATPSRILSSSLFIRNYGNNCDDDSCRDEYRQNVGPHWMTP
jgi:hypothetical protein